MSINYIQEFDRLFALVFNEKGEVISDDSKIKNDLIAICDKISPCGANRYNDMDGNMKADEIVNLQRQLTSVKRI